MSNAAKGTAEVAERNGEWQSCQQRIVDAVSRRNWRLEMDKAKVRVDAEGDLSQLISFMVGEEEYGLDILRVKEVIRVREITRLPKAPSFVRGIINLRGDVIPIIDLRDKFGMVVDSASQVVRIPADQIDPPPPIVGGLSAEYVHGVGKLDDRLVILLDIDRILTATERLALDDLQVAVAAEPAAV
jgi:purine-binding chemotaxis protein CheW